MGHTLEAGIRPSNIGLKRVESDILLDIGLNFLPISEFLLFMCPCPWISLFSCLCKINMNINMNEHEHEQEHI
jgi:hypothetical protein